MQTKHSPQEQNVPEVLGGIGLLASQFPPSQSQNTLQSAHLQLFLNITLSRTGPLEVLSVENLEKLFCSSPTPCNVWWQRPLSQRGQAAPGTVHPSHLTSRHIQPAGWVPGPEGAPCQRPSVPTAPWPGPALGLSRQKELSQRALPQGPSTVSALIPALFSTIPPCPWETWSLSPSPWKKSNVLPSPTGASKSSLRPQPSV